MTDARTFRRGGEYARGGLVGPILERDGSIEAGVRGTQHYLTKLWRESGELLSSCTCPLGHDGIFCKHCVALGLAWIGEGPPESDGESQSAASPNIDMNEIRRLLMTRDKADLTDILVKHAMSDDRLMRRLLVESADAKGPEPNSAVYRSVIDDAVRANGFVGYHEATSYAQGIEEAVDAIEKLLGDDQAAVVVELAEYALSAVEQAIGSVDDSDGNMQPILDRLQDIHHSACVTARPDRLELAKKLFGWGLNSEWDVFSEAASTYKGVLGTEGLAHYRALAEAEWARVKPLAPGKKDETEFTARFRITSIMKTLARQTGDVDELVAVLSRDLSVAYHFLEIAEECKKAGRDEMAVQWAEKGVSAFPEHTDSRLREFLAGEYHRLNRHGDAVALLWAEFVDSPRLGGYVKLKSHAERSSSWPEWRSKAFSLLRTEVAAEKLKAKKSRWAWARVPDNSTIVEILIWEKDHEGAWQEARAGGCSESLWLQLATSREEAHPEDALPVYQRRIEPTLERKNIDAYHEAVSLLQKIHGLMKQLGREENFKAYLEQVQTAHRPKRNFMKMLQQVRWR